MYTLYFWIGKRVGTRRIASAWNIAVWNCVGCKVVAVNPLNFFIQDSVSARVHCTWMILLEQFTFALMGSPNADYLLCCSPQSLSCVNTSSGSRVMKSHWIWKDGLKCKLVVLVVVILNSSWGLLARSLQYDLSEICCNATYCKYSHAISASGISCFLLRTGTVNVEPMLEGL